MKKYIGLVITFMILISALVGCQQKEYRKPITTDYDDQLEIYAYLSGNLHGTYFTCEIRSDETEGYAYFFREALFLKTKEYFADLRLHANDKGFDCYFKKLADGIKAVK